MERRVGYEGYTPIPRIEGHIVDVYDHVIPGDLISLRREAILYLAGRETTEEEQTKIKSGLHVDLGDIKVVRVIFPNGCTETFREGEKEYRFQYYRAEDMVCVRRGPEKTNDSHLSVEK